MDSKSYVVKQQADKRDEMIRYILSLESLESSQSYNEGSRTIPELQDEISLWQARQYELTESLADAHAQLQKQIQRNHELESKLQVIWTRTRFKWKQKKSSEFETISASHSRLEDLLKVALSWETTSGKDSDSQSLHQSSGINKPKRDFSDLNAVALQRLKSAAEVDGKLKGALDASEMYQKAYEVGFLPRCIFTHVGTKNSICCFKKSIGFWSRVIF